MRSSFRLGKKLSPILDVLRNGYVVCVIVAIIDYCVCHYISTFNTLVNTPNHLGKIAGFWTGFWDGILSPLTLLRSLFESGSTIYEFHNSGAMYTFGFSFPVIFYLITLFLYWISREIRNA